MRLRFAIEMAPQRSARGSRDPARGVDVDVLHEREVDHQAAVDGGPPANVVTAAADRDLEAVVAGETHGACDVGAPET